MAKTFQRQIEKKRALALSFPGSGLTRKAYCHKKKIALSTLDWWLRKVRKERSDQSRPDPDRRTPLFIPISPEVSPGFGNRFEVRFPDGTALLLPPETRIENIIRIIRESGGGA